MNNVSFLKEVGMTKCQGDGFRRDMPLGLDDFTTFSTGTPVTGASNPALKVNETNATVLQWAASDVTPAGLNFTVPRDYDYANKELKLRMLCQTSAATTPAITVNIYRKRIATALTADLGPKVGDVSVPAVASNGGIVTVDLSGLDIQGDDTVTLKITPAAHGTDTVSVYSAVIQYKSDLAYYNESAR